MCRSSLWILTLDPHVLDPSYVDRLSGSSLWILMFWILSFWILTLWILTLWILIWDPHFQTLNQDRLSHPGDPPAPGRSFAASRTAVGLTRQCTRALPALPASIPLTRGQRSCSCSDVALVRSPSWGPSKGGGASAAEGSQGGSTSDSAPPEGSALVPPPKEVSSGQPSGNTAGLENSSGGLGGVGGLGGLGISNCLEWRRGKAVASPDRVTRQLAELKR